MLRGAIGRWQPLPPSTTWRSRSRSDSRADWPRRCSQSLLLPEEVAGVVGSRHPDVEQRYRAHGDGDAAFGALGHLRVGGEGGQYEGDQRDDDAEPGDEREKRGGIVGEVDETVKDT